MSVAPRWSLSHILIIFSLYVFYCRTLITFMLLVLSCCSFMFYFRLCISIPFLHFPGFYVRPIFFHLRVFWSWCSLPVSFLHLLYIFLFHLTLSFVSSSLFLSIFFLVVVRTRREVISPWWYGWEFSTWIQRVIHLRGTWHPSSLMSPPRRTPSLLRLSSLPSSLLPLSFLSLRTLPAALSCPSFTSPSPLHAPTSSTTQETIYQHFLLLFLFIAKVSSRTLFWEKTHTGAWGRWPEVGMGGERKGSSRRWVFTCIRHEGVGKGCVQNLFGFLWMGLAIHIAAVILSS